MKRAHPQINDPIAQQALERFVQLARDEYRDRLQRIVLYGSYARGEADRESDLDVLVVLSEMGPFWDEADRLGKIAYQATFDSDLSIVLFALPMTEEQFRTEISPLLLNIRREGVEVP